MNDSDFDLGLRKKRAIAFVAILATSAVFGVMDVLFYYHKSWTEVSWVINAIVSVLLVYTWVRYDALIRKELITGGLRLGIFLLAIVAVPIYLQRTRGWKGAAKVGFGLPVYIFTVLTYDGGWYSARWFASRFGYYQ